MVSNDIPSGSMSPGKRCASTSELPRPRTKRRKGLNAMTDAEVWHYSDEEILAATRQTWRSDVYDHYDLHLERRLDALGNPQSLVIRFQCKYGFPGHSPQVRERLRSGDGTQKFHISSRACNINRGRPADLTDQSEEQAEYSEARHRAKLATRRARLQLSSFPTDARSNSGTWQKRQASVELIEEGNEVVVRAEVPGVQKGDLDIRLGGDGQSLTIEGRVRFVKTPGPTPAPKRDNATESENAVQGASKSPDETPTETEFRSSFTRSLWLPHRVDGQKASAELKDGVLTLRVPRAEEVTQRININ